MELNVSAHSLFCFTVLLKYVLQRNAVGRRLVQEVNCCLGSERWTGLDAGWWLLFKVFLSSCGVFLVHLRRLCGTFSDLP